MAIGPKTARLGLLGTGRFGARIRERLPQLGDLVWAAGSESDYTALPIPDWVCVATPTPMHFEHVEFFLRAGANVFVEKPATLSVTALQELLDLAASCGKRFYIDDVFMYRQDVARARAEGRGPTFAWHKPDNEGHGSLLERLAYHHLYLLHDARGGDVEFRIENCIASSRAHLEFDARIDDKTFRWTYRLEPDGTTRHIVFGVALGAAPGDALTDMLSAVISGRADFDANHRRSLWATSTAAEMRRVVAPTTGIVGGGIFGATAAIELASRGQNVVLYERHPQLFREATGINQYRVHKGYHYPRSRETASECRDSSESFARVYRQAIVPKRSGIRHFYAIASKDSLTTANEFIQFVDGIGLPYRRAEPLPGTDLTLEVEEELFDPARLREMVATRMKASGVDVRLGLAATTEDLDRYDSAIVATYANLNDWCDAPRNYQYELCEKPVLKLPDQYRMKSIVIMDGPFMCIDPYGSTELHVMGNVVHAIHNRNVGPRAEIPPGYETLLNKGVVANPHITNIDKFISSATRFFPGIEQAVHVGSMFTIRTVLPNRDSDDARPTIVEWLDDRRLIVFSGKICTSIHAARTAANLLAAGQRK